ncbi:MAG: hypothetical protein LAT81_16435 [Oceanicaulis sp.]|nr:hypothetical protein [Oceanicaulis sp.]
MNTILKTFDTADGRISGTCQAIIAGLALLIITVTAEARTTQWGFDWGFDETLGFVGRVEIYSNSGVRLNISCIGNQGMFAAINFPQSSGLFSESRRNLRIAYRVGSLPTQVIEGSLVERSITVPDLANNQVPSMLIDIISGEISGEERFEIRFPHDGEQYSVNFTLRGSVAAADAFIEQCERELR